MDDATTNDFTKSITIACYFSKCHELYFIIWSDYLHTNESRVTKSVRQFNDVVNYCSGFRANIYLHNVQYCQKDS